MNLEPAVDSYLRNRPPYAFAAAVIKGDQTQTASRDREPCDRFEIGSITKVLTAILLCEAVSEGKCSLDDPISKWIGNNTPSYGGQPITLRHLATHTSGLPRLPRELALRAAGNPQPYAGWTRERVIDAFLSTNLGRPPANRYVYSNFGFAVLGIASEQILGKPDAELLQDLTVRLGCPDIRLPHPGDRSAKGKPVAPWDMAAFVPAGGATATLAAMIDFARANLDPKLPALSVAMAEQGRYPTGSWRLLSLITGSKEAQTMALGWHIRGTCDSRALWHNGGTAGFRSMLILRPTDRAASIVLSADTHSPDEFAFQLIRDL